MNQSSVKISDSKEASSALVSQGSIEKPVIVKVGKEVKYIDGWSGAENEIEELKKVFFEFL